MLHAMLKTFGAFPTDFSTAGKFASDYFNSEGSFKLGYGYAPMSDFPEQAAPFANELARKVKEPPEGSSRQRHAKRLEQLADLLSQCVVPEPNKRATPEALLSLAFVQF